MLLWEELLQIASTIEFSDNDDDIIWQYESKRRYSVQSLYSVVSFRGVTPMYVPPRIHIFLWLLSRNKMPTRDNLGKKESCMIKHACFAVRLSRLITYSLIVV